MKKFFDFETTLNLFFISIFVFLFAMLAITEMKAEKPKKAKTAFTWIVINGVETRID